jgi:hypothetical protein
VPVNEVGEGLSEYAVEPETTQLLGAPRAYAKRLLVAEIELLGRLQGQFHPSVLSNRWAFY